jgi:hypothetical protein
MEAEWTKPAGSDRSQTCRTGRLGIFLSGTPPQEIGLLMEIRTATIDSRRLRAWGLFAGVFVLTWVLAGWIVSGNSIYLIMAAVASAGLVATVVILQEWRAGIFIFLVWLVFEDLIRKYAGNGLFMFFGKDIIVGITYISMLAARRRGQLLTFKPPFLVWLLIFFGVGLIQMFNPNSPSIFYGLLGMKTYFYYVPLLYAGYAILRSETDLHKLLMLNMWIALVVSGVGIVQALGANNFLNPANEAPELLELSHESRMAPQSGLVNIRPPSVFVSEGRFAFFLFLFFILAFGAVAYVALRKQRGRPLVFSTLAAVSLATILHGGRGDFVYFIVGAVVLTLAFLWGSPWRRTQAFRLRRAISVAAVSIVLVVAAAVVFFPDEVRSRWALYTETLSPASSTSDLGFRAWDYPFSELMKEFSYPNWGWGYGIGVSSLGAQYVYKLTGVPAPIVGPESGYALLLVEFGLAGPILWTLWTVGVIVAAWKVVLKVKQTPFFPLAFAIFWYAFLLLGPFTFYSLNTYQNYLNCAYLWLLIGMLFRLPGLWAETQARANALHATAAA